MKAALLVAVVAVVALGGVAAAQPADVPALISLIEQQPPDLDRLTWKDQRRDAARKLAASGDKRAVPVLIDLAEDETFDIIGEIAIEGLGDLGDPAAVPVLQKIAGDQSRDANQRALAKQALAKLGAKAEARDGDRDGDGDGDAGGGGEVAVGGVLLGDGEGAPSGPTWGDEVLGATERLTLALGSASLGYDSVRKNTSFDLDVAGSYQRSLDRQRNAYRFGADAELLAASYHHDGPESSKLAALAVGGHGEFRAYTASGVYAIAFGAIRLEGSRLTYSPEDAAAPDSIDKWLAFDGQLAVGGGWGRVLDVGSRLRVERIESALARGRVLGRPIDAAIARRLQSSWWTLRAELGSHRRLTATVAILREAGVLLGEPDAGTTYELLQILQDGQLDGRAAGVDVHVAFGESYLYRRRFPADEDPLVPEGRYETLLLRARLARQLGAESDATGEVFGRYRVFAPDGERGPWALGVRAQWRKFVYAEHFDPTGALDVAAEIALSDDDRDDTELGARLAGEVGWTLVLSRASSLRVAGEAAIDAGELFLGARLEARYGWLDNAFAR